VSDVYGAIKESAINRAIHFLMAWRPSLFNYVAPSQYVEVQRDRQTAAFTERWLVCQALNPPAGQLPYLLYTRRPPLKIEEFPGIPYCVQITDLAVDFQPSNVIGLPPELNPPLDDQQFAVWGKVHAGIGCPSDALVNALLREGYYSVVSGRMIRPEGHDRFSDDVERNHVDAGMAMPMFHAPSHDITSLICFSLEFFATGHLYTDIEPGTSNPPITRVRVALDGTEIKDLLPSGLEDAVECYIRTVIRGYLLPKLLVDIEPILVKALGIKIIPTLTPGLPHNPAIEQDELRVWLDIALTN
jgi:hypothetical protein